MAVVYTSTLKDTRMTDVVTAIGTSGFLVIGTSSLASPSTGVIVKLPLDTTAGTVSSGVLTLNGLPLAATNSGTGTAAKAEIWKSDNTSVITGLTVGTSGTDVILSTVTFATTGLTTNISTGTITHG